MGDIKDKYAQLTVAEAIELNKAAEWFCGHEITADGCADE